MDFSPELHKLLALEYHCDPEALVHEGILITESRLHPGRRMYNHSPHFFHMVTLGGGAVITADPVLHPFFHRWTPRLLLPLSYCDSRRYEHGGTNTF